ncbi:MAG: hypothetical protein PWQ84_1767, partial [Thermotogaceae bacterium]|nr:hypothetical protein [Thermotogaceae bacterium]
AFRLSMDPPASLDIKIFFMESHLSLMSNSFMTFLPKTFKVFPPKRYFYYNTYWVRDLNDYLLCIIDRKGDDSDAEF